MTKLDIEDMLSPPSFVHVPDRNRLYSRIIFKPGMKVHWCHYRPHYSFNLEENAKGVVETILEYQGATRFFPGAISTIPDSGYSRTEHRWLTSRGLQIQSNFAHIFEPGMRVVVYSNEYEMGKLDLPAEGTIIELTPSDWVSAYGLGYRVDLGGRSVLVAAKAMIPVELREFVESQEVPNFEALERSYGSFCSKSYEAP